MSGTDAHACLCFSVSEVDWFWFTPNPEKIVTRNQGKSDQDRDVWLDTPEFEEWASVAPNEITDGLC